MDNEDDILDLENLNKVRDRFENDYLVYHDEYDKQDLISMRKERGYGDKNLHDKFRAWLMFSEFDPFFFDGE